MELIEEVAEDKEDYVSRMKKTLRIIYYKSRVQCSQSLFLSLSPPPFICHHVNNMCKLEVRGIGLFNKESVMYAGCIDESNEIRGTFKVVHTMDVATTKEFEIPPETVAVYQSEGIVGEVNTFHVKRGIAFIRPSACRAVLWILYIVLMSPI